MVKALKITAIVLFLLILGFFGLQAWLGNKIVKVIEEKGSEMNGGIYTVTVEKASVNLFGRSATLKGVRMVPDRETAEGEGKSDMIFDVSIDGVYASGLSLKLLKEGSGAKLRSVEIDRPLITADIYKAAEKEAEEVTKDSSAAKKPLDIPLKKLVINNGNVILRQHSGGQASYTEADDINVNIRLKNKGRRDTLSVRELVDGGLSVRNVLMTNADGSVDTKIDSISLNTGKGELRIASIEVEPKYPMTQFVYKSSKHTDWTELQARDIYMSGVDALFMDGSTFINADSIHIGSGHVDSYKDRNANQPYRYKKLFFESVQQLPFLVRTGKIVVGTMNAVYRELPQMGTEPGIINFTGLSGTFDGLTNIPDQEEPYYTLAAHGFMYGKTPLNATFYFPKAESTNRFEAVGSLGSMNMADLNKMIIPLAKAEIEEGTIDRMEFHIVGNTGAASSNLTLLYHGLKIALLKKTTDNGIKERKFLSWAANTFVVKDNNPSNGETRQGSGTAERDPNRSQFNLLWKALFAGIKETAM